MKNIRDYQEEVLTEMVNNQTLVLSDGKFFVEDGVSDKEIQEALICRYSSKMNEYLIEPYGQARIHQRKTDEVIKQVINLFADQIESDCAMLFVKVPQRGSLLKSLYESLEARFE